MGHRVAGRLAGSKFAKIDGRHCVVRYPLVTGRRAMVTSLEPLASMAGMRIIEQGGNAFDAAVATALAVTVLDPRMSSIGGQGSTRKSSSHSMQSTDEFNFFKELSAPGQHQMNCDVPTS